MSDTSFIVTWIAAGTFLVMTLGLLVATLVMTVLTHQRAERLSAVEEQVKSINATLTAFMGDDFTPQMQYRSVDGKYVAESFDELIQLMQAGGDLSQDPKDIEDLRKFFENMTEGMDDEDKDKPWDKGN